MVAHKPRMSPYFWWGVVLMGVVSKAMTLYSHKAISHSEIHFHIAGTESSYSRGVPCSSKIYSQVKPT